MDLGEAPAANRWTEFAQRLPDLPWRSIAVAVAVVLVGVGGCLALRSDPRDAAIVLPRAGPAPPLPAATPAADAPSGAPADGGGTSGTAPGSPEASGPAAAGAELLIHAAGAVAHPGVYRFDGPVRVIDLLAAAGGPGSEADLSGVNLAAPLADGMRVYFPHLGEESPPDEVPLPAAPTLPSPGGPGDPTAPAPPIDINTAGAAELQTLPGIGPVTAGAIVEHRNRNGPFASLDDLQDVSGIGPAKLARIRDLVTVGATRPPATP